jgi:PAS domain S-box-containing protein
MTLDLFEPMRLRHLATPYLQWSYYFSARGDLIAIYPFAPYSDLAAVAGSATVGELIAAWLAYDVFTLGSPGRNPAGSAYWTPAYEDAGGKGWMVSHAAPVLGPGGAFAGVVGADLGLAFLADFLRGFAPPAGEILVADDQGRVLAGSRDGAGDAAVAALADRLPAALRALPPADVLRPAGRDGAFRDLGGGYWAVAHRLENAPLTLVHLLAPAELDGLVLPRLVPHVTAAALLLLSLAAAQILLRQGLVRPAFLLVRQIRAEAAGEVFPPPRVPAPWQPWFDAVREAFAGRRAYEARLAASEARLKAAAESMPDGLVILDAEDRIVFFNDRHPEHLPPALREALRPGVRFADWIREGLARGPVYHPDMGEGYAERRLASRPAAGQDATEREHKHADGRWVRVREGRMPDGGRVLLTTDVTARKEAEARVEASEQRFLAAAESIPDGLAILDADDRLVFHNGRYPEHLVPALRDVLRLGERFPDMIRAAVASGPLYHPDMGADFAERRLALRRQERSEHEHRLADGRWVRIRESRMADGGRVLLSTDVTEARARDQERAMLAAAVGQVADSVEIVGADFRLLYVNPAFTALTGWTEAEALGRTPAEILRSGEHDKVFYAGIEAALAAGETWRGRLVSRHKDGRLLHQEATVSPVRDAAGGRVTHSVAVKRDVSERTRAEAALAASEARFRTIVEDQTEFISRFTPDFRITFVNRAYAAQLGRSREELVGSSLLDLMDPAQRDRFRAQIAALTPEAPTVSYEMDTVLPTGGGAGSGGPTGRCSTRPAGWSNSSPSAATRPSSARPRRRSGRARPAWRR